MGACLCMVLQKWSGQPGVAGSLYNSLELHAYHRFIFPFLLSSPLKGFTTIIRAS